MRPKLILLVIMIAMSVSFMAFLVAESHSTTVTCEKKKPANEIEKGVLEVPVNHLIVSK